MPPQSHIRCKVLLLELLLVVCKLIRIIILISEILHVPQLNSTVF